MEKIKLDLVPSGKMPSLHASQYDDGREHGIDLFENGVVYKLDGTETLTINERKGDDCICSLDIENTFADTNHIVFASTEQMCAVWGNNICELVIAKGEKTIGTLNFILEVEPSPTENGIESESEIKNLKRQVEAITEEVIGDDYYTKTQTDDAIATAVEGKADKTDTYTKTQVDTALNGKADKDTTYTKTQVDSEISRLDGRIDTKANASDVYTKSQTDNLLNDKADVSDLPDMSQYYDKSEVDDLLDEKANSDDVYGKAYIDTALSGKANVGTSYTKSEEDDLLANKADKSDTYTKAQVDDIVYNILPDDTANGSVANFETDLALPLKSLEVDVNAVQEAGTPTPATPLPISGWSAVNLTHCGKNLVDIKPFNEWETSNAYCLLFNCIPNKQVKMSFIDKDVSVDVSDIYFGFVDSNYNKVSALTPQKYRWCLNQGSIVNNRTNLSTQGVNILTGLFMYPKAQDVFERLFARYNIVVSVNDETAYEPYNGSTTLINLGGTYYGGRFTQDKDGHRQFEVTHGIKSFRDIEFNYSNNEGQWQHFLFYGSINDKLSTSLTLLCTNYEAVNEQLSTISNEKMLVASWGNYIYIRDDAYTTVADFKTANANTQVVYPLATPIIIDLPDGEPIITLNGTNNIYANTGDCAVEYKVSIEQYVSNHSGGGGAKSLGGVFLGGSNSGGEEEPISRS